MKKLVLLVVFAMLATVCLAADVTRSYSVRKGKHLWTFKFTVSDFPVRRHTAVMMPPRAKGEQMRIWIDGGDFVAPDYFIPYTELSRFEVTLDGRPVPIPLKYWRDVFDPNLKRKLRLETSGDGRTLVIGLATLDGAYALEFEYTISSSGKIRRRLQGME